MQLRPYQQEAVEAIHGEWEAGNRSTLLVAATGTGKTFTTAHVIKEALSRGERVLTLAHRDELLQQSAESISTVCGLPPWAIMVEKGRDRATASAQVVVASIQSMRGDRLKRWPKSHFGMIWVDEAHHAVSPTYQAVLERFQNAKVLGVTATPDRLDKKGMGQVFDSVAHAYEIVDAINDGYLCPIKSRIVVVESMDLGSLRTRRGDWTEGDLERQLTTRPSLYEVAKPTVEIADERPTLVFAATVLHAELLTKVINTIRPGSADFLSGSDPVDRRRGVLDAFRERQVQFLVNCQLFTEGTDLPLTSCVAVARPTQSRALYTQMVGRGTRLSPGKENLLILDFTDNALCHKLICALDILDGNDDPAVKRKATEAAVAGEVDPMAAMDKAADAIAEEERAKMREMLRYRKVAVDPFAVIGHHVRHQISPISPTEKQTAFLERHGFPTKGISKREASRIIGKVIKRFKDGYCTPRQSRLLAKRGLDCDLTREEADQVIDYIAKAKWATPPEIRRKYAAKEE
jgi:superfamily II DNA or RNA helicase